MLRRHRLAKLFVRPEAPKIPHLSSAGGRIHDNIPTAQGLDTQPQAPGEPLGWSTSYLLEGLHDLWIGHSSTRPYAHTVYSRGGHTAGPVIEGRRYGKSGGAPVYTSLSTRHKTAFHNIMNHDSISQVTVHNRPHLDSLAPTGASLAALAVAACESVQQSRPAAAQRSGFPPGFPAALA